MATEEVYLKGTTDWFWHNRLNKFGKWAHRLYPDTESLEKIRDLQAEGVKNQLKKNEENVYYVNISRPPSLDKWTEVGKKTVALPAPVVIDDKGNPYAGNVGNGSTVTTKVEVYSHKTPAPPGSTTPGKAKAMRWVSSRIDSLVPYEAKTDFPEQDKKAVAGLEKQASPKDIF